MDKIKDVIIIGSGSAGLAAGLYAGRAQLSALIIEKDAPGGQIKITSEVVNYPGVLTISGAEISQVMKKQAESFGTQFISANVLEVKLSGDIKEVVTDKGTFRAVSVIAATGATPRELNFKGESEFKGKGIGFCATCDGEFFSGMQVFVVGAGFAAAEEALYLTRFARQVTVIAREPEFTCSKSIADRVIAHPKIKVEFNTEIVEAGGENTLKYAKFKNNKTGKQWEYRLSEGEMTFGIFIFAGYIPQSKLFQPYVKTDKDGYILTDDDMNTQTPGVFAAGDIRTKSLRQLVTAAADGAIAAQTAERYVTRKKEELGIAEPQIGSDDQTCDAAPEPEVAPIGSGGSEYLDDNLRQQIAEVLAKLTSTVTIALFSDASEIAQQMQEYIEDFSRISKNIKIKLHKSGEEEEYGIKVSMYPSFALLRQDGTYSGIQFHGVPGGHEVDSFVLALYNVGGPGQRIDEESQPLITSIDRPVNVKVGISLSCALCPDVVAYTQLIAANNKNVEAEMVDVAHFPKFRNKYSIMSVPAIVINDSEVHFGKRGIADIAKLLKNSAMEIK